MTREPDRCANCQADVAADRQAGLGHCRQCGAPLSQGSVPPPLPSPAPANPPPQPLASPAVGAAPVSEGRGLVRICFWVLFLLGPALGCLAWTKPERWLAMLPQAMRDSLHGLVPPAPMFWVALLLAAGGAGWCLVQLHVRPKTTFSRIATTMAFTAIILVTYAVLAISVAFVGCLMGLGR